MRIAAFSNQGEARGVGSDGMTFLKDASASDWAKLFRYTRDQSFQPGEILIRERAVDRSMYLVLAGQLEIWIGQEGKEAQAVSQIEAGEIFGEQSFMDGLPRSGTVRAVNAGDVKILDWRTFEQLAVQEPRLARDILEDIARTLSMKLRQTNRLLV